MNRSNYSKEDGIITCDLNLNSVSIKNSDNICKSCENENKIDSSYCKYCGESLCIIENKREDITEISEKIGFRYNDILGNYKQVLLGIGVAIVILLIMTTAVSAGAAYGLGSLEVLRTINPIRIILLLNLGVVDVYSTSMMGSGSANLSIGIFIVVLIPLLVCFISSKMYLRKVTNSIDDLLRNSIGFGIVYGTVLAIFAMVATFRSSGREFVEYGYMVEFSFKASSVFLNGFLIGSIATYLSCYKSEFKDENKYIDILKKVINVVFIGYIVTTIIIFVVTYKDSSYLYELGMYGYTDIFDKSVLISQLGVYIWSIANFIPVTIMNTSLSVFEIVTSGMFLDTKLVLLSIVFISLLIMILVGVKLRNEYSEEDGIKPVLLISLCYSLIIGTICIFSNITIGSNVSLLDMNNYQMSVNMGFEFIIGVVVSFIYSFIAIGIGYKLSK